MGLLLGASLMTLFELLDLIFYNLAVKLGSRGAPKESESRADENERVENNDPFRDPAKIYIKEDNLIWRHGYLNNL